MPPSLACRNAHANLFEHHALWLASRRPIWSDMTPVNIPVQDWMLPSDVTNVLSTDPTT